MMNNDSPKLNRKERAFIFGIDEPFWIARDMDEDLYLYFREPERMKTHWLTDWKSCRKMNDKYFRFITWESGKVWSRDELLKLEVIE